MSWSLSRSGRSIVAAPPVATRRRVLLAASTPLSFAVLAPMARSLASDPEIDLFVTLRHGGRRDAERCLNVPFQFVSKYLVQFRSFDVALCPGFSFTSRRVTTSVQTFHGVSFKNYAVRESVREFEKIFLIGPYHRDKMVRRGFIQDDDARALNIGMPKTDPLVANSGRDDVYLAGLGLNPDLPTIAYAPTRSGEAGSSLESGGLAIVEHVAARTGANVLVKLHDRSIRQYRRKLDVDYEVAVREIATRCRNVRLIQHHDVIPVLRAADLLISDLSSAANEFLLRDRPIVYLAAPEHERRLRESHRAAFPGDVEDLDFMREAGDVASTPSEALRAVELGFSDPTQKSVTRQARAERLFYNPGGATVAATDALRSILQLDVERKRVVAR